MNLRLSSSRTHRVTVPVGCFRIRVSNYPVLGCACLARRFWDPDLSHPDTGMEFLNSPTSPHRVHTPWLVGPLGLSINQR